MNATHPAILAAQSGLGRPYATGDDWTAYLVTINGIEYLVTLNENSHAHCRKVG